MRHAHAMPFGAATLPAGGVRFRLWAPAAGQVTLVWQAGDAEPSRIAAAAQAGGWHEASVAQARAGDRYQWAVPTPDGEVRVPDPASRSNPGGPHAPSAVVDPHAFEWDDTPWPGRPWTEAVLYEMHIGAFTPQGSFAAAQEKLPALAELGITALQIMPLASFPGRFGWGYDGVLPYAPHPAYGTPEDFKRFVQAAHRLGLMVLLDVVYNHFGPDGNYLSLYAPQFFTARHATPWGDAFNFDGEHSRPVREFFIHNALYWILEFQLDGLRFDAVHAMLDDTPQHVLDELSRRVREQAAGRHVHLVLENDSNDAARLAPPGAPGRFDGQWSGDFHHTLHVLLTHEGDGYYREYVEAPLQQLGRCLTHGFAREGEPHLASAEGQARNPRRAAGSTVPLSATVNFLQNHDQIGNRAFGERLTQLLAGDTAPLRLALAVLLLAPAPPMLFMGEEHGATTPFLYFADWDGPLRDAVTNGRRREFAHFPRFADPQVQSRIPDPCSAATFERSRLDWPAFETEPARRWHALCAELLAWRAREITPRLPLLASGQHSAELIDGRALRVRWRFDAAGGMPRELEMIANLSPAPVAQALPSPIGGAPWRIGDISADRIGAWSGLWRWNDGVTA